MVTLEHRGDTSAHVVGFHPDPHFIFSSVCTLLPVFVLSRYLQKQKGVV